MGYTAQGRRTNKEEQCQWSRCSKRYQSCILFCVLQATSANPFFFPFVITVGRMICRLRVPLKSRGLLGIICATSALTGVFVVVWYRESSSSQPDLSQYRLHCTIESSSSQSLHRSGFVGTMGMNYATTGWGGGGGRRRSDLSREKKIGRPCQVGEVHM